jgi:hypothetical protein
MSGLKNIRFSYQNIYFFGLMVLAFGLSWSNFLMSVSQLILALNWFAEGKIKQKFFIFFRNRTAMLLSAVFLIHFLWLFNTEDFQYAFRDIRIKIPLFVLPLFFSTSVPLDKKRLSILLHTFIAGVLLATSISIVLLSGVTTIKVNDVREISGFISHIRFALCICIAILLLIPFSMNKDVSLKIKVFYLLMIIWLVVFLGIMQSGTGFSILIIYALFFLAYKVFTVTQPIQRILYISIFVAFPLLVIFYINNAVKEFYYTKPVDLNKLEKFTVNGNAYNHYTTDFKRENGVYSGIYICWKELEAEWNRRSSINFNGYDRKEQEIKFTICRYLASKNLRKDSLGMSKLNTNDIQAIENGVTNFKGIKPSGINTRLQQTIWEFDSFKNGENPGGQSVLMRLEYWKTGLKIISDHWLFGVGTGDVQQEFLRKYKETNSILSEKYRRHTHNQYLTFWISFGIFGLLIFIASLVLPLMWNRASLNHYYVTFFIVVCISMLTEDTLETQAGVTFFAFFNTLYLFTGATKKLD